MSGGCRARGEFEVLIVAARRSGVGLDCRADRRPAGSTSAFERGAPAVALDVHLEDGGVVDKAIDDGQRHRLVGGPIYRTACCQTARKRGPRIGMQKGPLYCEGFGLSR